MDVVIGVYEMYTVIGDICTWSVTYNSSYNVI